MRRVLWLFSALLAFVVGFLVYPMPSANASVTHSMIVAASFNPFSWLSGLVTSGIWSLIQGPLLGEAASGIYSFIETKLAPLFSKIPDSIDRILVAILSGIGSVSIAGTVIPLPTTSGGVNQTWIAGVLAAVVGYFAKWMQQHKAAAAAKAPAVAPTPAVAK